MISPFRLFGEVRLAPGRATLVARGERVEVLGGGPVNGILKIDGRHLRVVGVAVDGRVVAAAAGPVDPDRDGMPLVDLAHDRLEGRLAVRGRGEMTGDGQRLVRVPRLVA